MASNLGEPRVPKPKSQGSASHGTPKSPLSGRNSHTAAAKGVVKKGGARSGSGDSGSKRNPPRC